LSLLADGTYFVLSTSSTFSMQIMEPSWSWSYGSWIYSYLCNQCI